ncbi:hypothetical protein C2E23DRAFT_800953 [Lenzites betulinus]|nr:hypothetical protein C2E23DRAFT_800953 [Lenzites betulinus]
MRRALSCPPSDAPVCMRLSNGGWRRVQASAPDSRTSAVAQPRRVGFAHCGAGDPAWRARGRGCRIMTGVLRVGGKSVEGRCEVSVLELTTIVWPWHEIPIEIVDVPNLSTPRPRFGACLYLQANPARRAAIRTVSLHRTGENACCVLIRVRPPSVSITHLSCRAEHTDIGRGRTCRDAICPTQYTPSAEMRVHAVAHYGTLLPIYCTDAHTLQHTRRPAAPQSHHSLADAVSLVASQNDAAASVQQITYATYSVSERVARPSGGCAAREQLPSGPQKPSGAPVNCDQR